MHSTTSATGIRLTNLLYLQRHAVAQCPVGLRRSSASVPTGSSQACDDGHKNNLLNTYFHFSPILHL